MRKESAVDIDAELVRKLIADQFPAWSALEVEPLQQGGWDNRTFRLGSDMLVRLPSAKEYAGQVERDLHWLSRLAPQLPLVVPAMLGMGQPAHGYVWKWAVYRWIDGETALWERISDLRIFATELALFLKALQRIDTAGGPEPDLDNFYRGGSLRFYHAEVRQAMRVLQGKIDMDTVTAVWETARSSSWQQKAVWVHGDISAGNLLVRDGRLAAVIDFGQLAVGDPACDIAIAWTFLSDESREAFKAALEVDEGTWDRGRGWALWKALIVAAGIAQTNAIEFADPLAAVETVIEDYRAG